MSILQHPGLRFSSVKLGEQGPFSIATLDDEALLEGSEAGLWPNPYWGNLWPSAIALAGHLIRHPEFVKGRRVMVLGCGPGAEALAAMMAGASVCIATDIVPQALELARYNVEKHCTVSGLITRHFNWTSDNFPRDVDLIIGADILFDAEAYREIIACFERAKGRRLSFLIAEPGRVHAAGFQATMEKYGWNVQDVMEPRQNGLVKSSVIHLWRGDQDRK